MTPEQNKDLASLYKNCDHKSLITDTIRLRDAEWIEHLKGMKKPLVRSFEWGDTKEGIETYSFNAALDFGIANPPPIK